VPGRLGHARPARWLLPLLLAAGLLSGGAVLAQVSVGAAATAGFDIVGRTSLGDRGMNAGLAVAGHCAYVGSRTDGPVEIVDVADPSSPRISGELPRHPGSTPRELRTVPDARELVVLSYDINGGPNLVEVYRWADDCARPVAGGSYDFGAGTPHEFYLWEDPGHAGRILLYVSMFGAAGDGLEVLDISNPQDPARLGGWTVPPEYGHAPLHSVDVGADGRTAYVSLWTGGLVVADAGDFVAGGASPGLRVLTPTSGVFRTSPGDVHSAVALPGRPMVLTTDERYPSQGCPFGSAHVVDVSKPAAPRAVSTLAVPENAPSACAAAARGTWTSHNATLTEHLALVSWYSAGLQVFSLDDPAAPVRLGELRPGGVTPRLRDLELGVTDTMTWSYPVVSNGLVYVVDINQGLLALRYHGPHEVEISSVAMLEGNSNVAAASPASPGASPSTAGSARTSPSPAAPASALQPALVAGGATLVIVVLLGAALLWRRRTRARR
jgi:hypothetical protein